MGEPSKRSIVVTPFSEAPAIQIGNSSISGLATPMQGSRQFEVWTAHHAPSSCTHFHRHDSDEVLIFLKGRGTIRTQTEAYAFEAPCSVVIPEGTLHQVCNSTDEPTQAFGIIAAGSRIFDHKGEPSAWRETHLKEQDGPKV